MIHRPSNANLNSSGAWGIGFSTRGDGNTSTTDTRAGIFSYYNGNLFLATSTSSIVADPDASARLTITNTGNVGIGTSSPAAPLSIAGSSTGEYDALILRNGNSNASGQSTAIIFEASAGTSGDEAASVAKISGLRTGAGSKGDLLFHTTLAGVSSERMRIDSSGVVQISNATPTLKFTDTDNNYDATIQGLSGSLVLTADSGAEFGTESMQFKTGAAERMRIDSSGNLLVGKTAASSASVWFSSWAKRIYSGYTHKLRAASFKPLKF